MPDKIRFEVSEYNLLFSKVEIEDKEYTALIDFGDFGDFGHFQFFNKLIAEWNLETEKSDMIMSDINGRQYTVEKGTIDELKIGDKIEQNVSFFSANNEIDAVSREVGTDFHGTEFPSKNLDVKSANQIITLNMETMIFMNCWKL